ncbi:hypothetical protein TNCV_1023831 [Trichonephila clavipes]|nr:hypothetical protein TNCV_1023831 [Trichonephila clavipes]
MKSLMYQTLASSIDDLIIRKSVAVERIRDMSGIFQNVLAASTARFLQFQRYAATLCQFLIFRVFKSFSTSSIHLVGGLPHVRDPIGFLNVSACHFGQGWRSRVTRGAVSTPHLFGDFL